MCDQINADERGKSLRTHGIDKKNTENVNRRIRSDHLAENTCRST